MKVIDGRGVAGREAEEAHGGEGGGRGMWVHLSIRKGKKPKEAKTRRFHQKIRFGLNKTALSPFPEVELRHKRLYLSIAATGDGDL